MKANQTPLKQNELNSTFALSTEGLPSRRLFLMTAIGSLVVGACDRSGKADKQNGREATVEAGINIKDFPKLSSALDRIKEQARSLSGPLSESQWGRQVSELQHAIASDLKTHHGVENASTLGLKALLSKFDDILIRRDEMLFRMEDICLFQHISIEYSGTVIPKGGYNFRSFGGLSTDVMVYRTNELLETTRDENKEQMIIPFRGTVFSFEDRAVVILNESQFSANAEMKITAADDRKKTIDNEIGHVHFYNLIRAQYPELADLSTQRIMSVNEAFSFYSNILHSDGRVVIVDAFEKAQEALDNHLPAQYELTMGYIVGAVNTFMDPNVSGAEKFYLNPDATAKLFSKALQDKVTLDALIEHFASYFEKSLKADLETLRAENSRQ